MILDACFLINLLDGKDRAVAKLDEVEDELLSVPTLVYTEVGVGIDPETGAGRQFEAVLERVRLVPYDAEAAKRAVDVQRQLRRDGESIGTVGATIAGAALFRDERVVTRNVGEFDRTPVRVSPYGVPLPSTLCPDTPPSPPDVTTEKTRATSGPPASRTTRQQPSTARHPRAPRWFRATGTGPVRATPA